MGILRSTKTRNSCLAQTQFAKLIASLRNSVDYCVGQTIRIINTDTIYNKYIRVGDIAEIRIALGPDSKNAYCVAAEFQHDINGHNAGGFCSKNRGWWLRRKDFEIVFDTEDDDIEFDASKLNMLFE